MSEPVFLNPGASYLVAGGGGFIGGHLVARLRDMGCSRVRAVDIKPIEQWEQSFPEVDNMVLDLSEKADCMVACENMEFVFNLACDMGGMGFIESNKALCMLSVLPTTHMLVAARDQGCRRLFYSSSACVYAADKQTSPEVVPLAEHSVYPAMPEDGYGWEKLFGERLARHFFEDFSLETHIARYHNVYGPFGTWTGGREKAPAAICRKVSEAVVSGRHEIEIWGDGEQTRSFTYIDDCLEGTLRLMESQFIEPLNIGSAELVSINDLVTIVEGIAGVTLERHYNLDAPQGVRGRNSDNTLIQQVLGWQPSVSLVEGLAATYEWVYEQVTARLAAR